MRASLFIFVLLTVTFFAFNIFPTRSIADVVTLYSQPDDSGEIVSQQAQWQTTYIGANLGKLALTKDALTITFSIKDPNANNTYHQPGGVAIGTCINCKELQKYSFTDADRTLLTDGQFHSFTVVTGTTTLALADGETDIYATFYDLSQHHNGTHLKSNSASTSPYLIITGPQPVPEVVAEAPVGSITVYEQSDKSSTMTNTQATYQSAHIDSASIGNLNLGQDKLYFTFTMKDVYASNVYHTPASVCIQEASSTNCGKALQTYKFTDADRTLLMDQGYHTFMVETGTTTSAYADGTHSVTIGFSELSQTKGGTKVRSDSLQTIPYFKIQKPAPPDPCAVPGSCIDSVLFLPGIEGSRLYEGTGCGGAAEEKLWDPIGDSILQILRGVGDDKVQKLFLGSGGAILCSDIYVKDSDVIDAVGGSNIYKSFISDLDVLKTGGAMADWHSVAYDWRLSLNDLLNKGRNINGKIYYALATSTPYIEQTLRDLAARSKTGKVAIVAHSNGGLVAKALAQKLGDADTEKLISKIILVGAPQSGAPTDVAALLYGYDAGIYHNGISILKDSTARALAQNSPMAYHLLPSGDYLSSTASDSNHPLIRFSGVGYEKELSAYGTRVDSIAELNGFLLATEGGREKPSQSQMNLAEIVNSGLIDYANTTHSSLDVWAPPSGIEVDQIAGWGVDTVAGIDFYTLSQRVSALASLSPTRMFRPIFTEDGDGTVTVPSALQIASSTNVKKYWVDLYEYNGQPSISDRNHVDIFEIAQLRNFIKSLVTNQSAELPSYLSSVQPLSHTATKKLTFFLHSPLTLELTDSLGNITGASSDGTINQQIAGATYGTFGDLQYITAPEGSYTLVMHGTSDGIFSLDIQESSAGVVTNTSTLANLQTTASTTATLSISGGLSTVSDLLVDEDDNGTNDITLTPSVGETVTYSPPVAAPAVSTVVVATAPVVSGSISIPINATTSQSVIIATTTTLSSSPIRIEDVPVKQIHIVSSPEPVTSEVSSPTVREVVEPAEEVLLVEPNLSQTASVYNAVSRHSFLQSMALAVYNGIHAVIVVVVNLL